MGYAGVSSVAAGLRFRTRSGVAVRTTGHTVYLPSRDIYVHEVEVVEGPGQGNRFLHNLDYAQPL